LLTPRVRKSAQYNVAAKMPNAVAMKRTMIVSVGMGGSLCFWGTMMLAALVEALILIKFRAHPLPDPPAGEAAHRKSAAPHALTPSPVGIAIDGMRSAANCTLFDYHVGAVICMVLTPSATSARNFCCDAQRRLMAA
jgi:hypothetical protein